jgi:hypothetical protein
MAQATKEPNPGGGSNSSNKYNELLDYNLDAAKQADAAAVAALKLSSGEAAEAETRYRQAWTEAVHVNDLMDAAADEENVTVAQQKKIQTRLAEIDNNGFSARPEDEIRPESLETDPYHEVKEALINQIATSFQSYQELGGKSDEHTVVEKAEAYVENLSEANLAWVQEEIEAGGTVDLIALTELPDIKTPEQAKKQVEATAEKLQDKLPYGGDPCVDSDLDDAETSDIIGDTRSELSFILVSRRTDVKYGGDVEKQKATSEEADANIVALSPEENLQRLVKIANETARANEGKTDAEQREAVRVAIVDGADYGYARNFKMNAVQDGVDRCVLSSFVLGGGRVYAVWSSVWSVPGGSVGAVK